MRASDRRAPYLALPCAVIDEAMPALRDTELRLLLVVIRQTWGWRGQDGVRKERDWLSHRQLCDRTGRASEAVSAAVEALVRRGLLRVEDAGGTELASADQRRRLRGRMYYRPGPLIGAQARRGRGGRVGAGKAKTTTDANASPCCPFRNSGRPGQEEREPNGRAVAGTADPARREIRDLLAAITAATPRRG